MKRIPLERLELKLEEVLTAAVLAHSEMERWQKKRYETTHQVQISRWSCGAGKEN